MSADRRLHLVLSMGAAADRSYTIIGTAVGIFRKQIDAQICAQAEAEMGEIVLEGRRFVQRTGISEITIPEGWPDVPKLGDIWIVWSNMLMQDGSGRAFNRVEGLYLTEEEAAAKVGGIKQGDTLHDGQQGRIKTKRRRLTVR